LGIVLLHLLEGVMLISLVTLILVFNLNASIYSFLKLLILVQRIKWRCINLTLLTRSSLSRRTSIRNPVDVWSKKRRTLLSWIWSLTRQSAVGLVIHTSWGCGILIIDYSHAAIVSNWRWRIPVNWVAFRRYRCLIGWIKFEFLDQSLNLVSFQVRRVEIVGFWHIKVRDNRLYWLIG
jgi:hypothetical protein